MTYYSNFSLQLGRCPTHIEDSSPQADNYNFGVDEQYMNSIDEQCYEQFTEFFYLYVLYSTQPIVRQNMFTSFFGRRGCLQQ